MEATLFTSLVMGETSVTLLLTPDPERRAPALAHALGFAISHLDEDLPELVRQRLGPLRDSFTALGDGATDERSALERLARSCRATIPGARLVLRRRVPVGQRAPHWPLALHSGAPSEAGSGIWPFDHELMALLLDRRRVVLREATSVERADADAAWLASHGLAVRRGAHHRVFASMHEDRLEEAIERHERSRAKDEGFRDSARWMGEALGYPPCCVETFVRARTRDDVTLAAELLPALGCAPATPLTLWLDGALALISHAPCSLECEPTRELAAAVLGELERRTPGFEGRWTSRARRLHVLDPSGRCFALDADGDLGSDGRLWVRGALELSPPKGDDLSSVCLPAADLEGEVRVERGWLVAPARPGWRGTLVADHRG